MTWKPVCDFSVDGHEYQIQLDTGSGEFICILPGEDAIKAPSLNALKEKLRKFRRSKSVAIPVTIADSDDDLADIKHGVVTGIHGRSGQYLFKKEGESRPYSTYERYFRTRFTPKQEKEFADLAGERDAALAALREWLGEREIDVKAEIEKAREEPEQPK